MKRFLALFILLLFFVASFAGNTDRYNVGTIKKTETAASIQYKWVVTFSANYDSTDRLHSPALLIADCNDADGYMSAVSSADIDCDGIIHTSIDNSTWSAHTADAGQNDINGTAKFDTVGIINGTNDIKFHSAKYLVYELDGQDGTSNADDQVITVNFLFTKDVDAVNNGQPVIMGGVVNSAGSP